MLCYLDRTFCPYWKTCSDGSICTAKLTKDIIGRAKDFGLPISRFTDKPRCYSTKESIHCPKTIFNPREK